MGASLLDRQAAGFTSNRYAANELISGRVDHGDAVVAVIRDVRFTGMVHDYVGGIFTYGDSRNHRVTCDFGAVDSAIVLVNNVSLRAGGVDRHFQRCWSNRHSREHRVGNGIDYGHAVSASLDTAGPRSCRSDGNT